LVLKSRDILPEQGGLDRKAISLVHGLCMIQRRRGIKALVGLQVGHIIINDFANISKGQVILR